MKKAQTKEADLGNGPIGSLLFKLALPAIVAQIINVMYNMVDRMYIGHIKDIGPDALLLSSQHPAASFFPAAPFKRHQPAAAASALPSALQASSASASGAPLAITPSPSSTAAPSF